MGLEGLSVVARGGEPYQGRAWARVRMLPLAVSQRLS